MGPLPARALEVEMTGEPANGLDHERLYAFRFRGVDRARKAGVWIEIAAWIHEALGRPARILDAAGGDLEFVSAVPSVERWVVDLARPSSPIPDGVRFVQGDCLSAPLPADYFDAVFVSNFLEHLESPDDVYRFLRRMKSLLKPGGAIACMGPNFRFCFREYFDCADHRLALTDVAVSEHLFAAGFEVVRSIPRFLPYSFRGKLAASRPLVRAYLGFPPAWRVLGKQFLVLGRRVDGRP